MPEIPFQSEPPPIKPTVPSKPPEPVFYGEGKIPLPTKDLPEGGEKPPRDVSSSSIESVLGEIVAFNNNYSLKRYEMWGKNIRRYNIEKDHENIGQIELANNSRTNSLTIPRIEIKKEHQEKGHASNIYDALGSYLQRNNLSLRSSGDLIHPGTIKIWEKLYASGKAILIQNHPDPAKRIYQYKG